jgi:DnaJ family protein C protein 9
MADVYATVMLSDPLEDEDRFRVIIDEAIEKGDVKGFKAYVNETAAAKRARMREAEGEAEEAMEYAKELGVADKLFGKGKKGKDSGEDALAALIQKRQEGRSSFLDNLEAKYANKAKSARPKGKKGKKRVSEDEDEDDGEPSEEAFQAAAARLKSKATETESASGRKTKRAKR